MLSCTLSVVACALIPSYRVCLYRFEFPYAAAPVSQDLWAAISRAIAASNPQIEHTISQPWTTASDFLDWIARSDFGGRPLVILCDEFDALQRLPAALQDEVLQALRRLRGPRNDSKNVVTALASRLQAFVGVGSFGLVHLIGTDPQVSPFNVHDTLQVQYFSASHQAEFVRQFERLRRASVHADVQADIAELTAGHPGQFARCYHFLERHIISGHASRPNASFAGWVQIRDALLDGQDFDDDPTLRKMEKNLLADSDIAREACKLLPHVLAGAAALPVTLNRSPAVQYLALIGVLRYADGGMLSTGPATECKDGESTAAVKRFVVSSPIVRAYLATRVLPRLGRVVPREPIPLVAQNDENTVKEEVNMVLLLQTGVKYMNRAYINDVLTDNYNTKICRVAPYCGQRIWGEFPLHFEFFAVLRAWLPNWMTGFPESVALGPNDGRKRVDIVLRLPEHCYLIDFISSATAAEMREHVSNMHSYAARYQPTEAWLCNITVGCDADITRIPKAPYALHALHVIVDPEFTRAAFVVDNGPDVPLQLLRPGMAPIDIASTDRQRVRAVMEFPVGQ